MDIRLTLDDTACEVTLPLRLVVRIFNAEEDGTPVVDIRHLDPDVEPLVVYLDGHIVVNRP